MPKLKTKKAVQKRFKITKRGKVTRMRQMAGHLKAAKSKSQKTRYKQKAFASKADRKVLKNLLPYAS